MSGNLAHTIIHAWEFIWSLPDLSIFWLTLMIEIPRYVMGLQAAALTAVLFPFQERQPLTNVPKVSVLVAGMNEQDTVEACVRSLRAQTFHDFEIICVSDGSTDDTVKIMNRLYHEGLVEMVIDLKIRGGKPGGMNLAANLARGDIYVVVDADCSFEDDAIEELLRPMIEDPQIHGVSGNILVRNWQKSITTSLQAIEYLISISLGKTFSNVMNQVTCISGAYGAFRKESWHQVGGMDPGGGEDLDYTLRLRNAGYKVCFSRESICYTDAPDNLYALLRQRGRWERDAFWIRLRKYKWLLSPRNPKFKWQETVHQLDFLALSVIPCVLFPFYVTWILVTFGTFGMFLLIAISMALGLLDLVMFTTALLITGKLQYWRLLAFVPIYGIFQAYVMRTARCYAYACEWIWSLSLLDNYTPDKIRELDTWR